MARKLYIPTQVNRKIKSFVNQYSFEVCMSGRVQKLANGSYALIDVFAIPQINGGTYVESDDERYPKFFHELVEKHGVEYTKTIRCFIHSHPSFSVSPSPHDTKCFKERDCMSVDDFYIMLITNQKGDWHCEVGEWIEFAGERTLETEKLNVEIKYIKDKEFLVECEKMVKERKYVAPTRPNYPNNSAVRYGRVTDNIINYGTTRNVGAVTRRPAGNTATTKKETPKGEFKESDFILITTVTKEHRTFKVMVDKELKSLYPSFVLKRAILDSDVIESADSTKSSDFFSDFILFESDTPGALESLSIIVKKVYKSNKKGKYNYILFIRENIYESN